jgi:hypothetical protein
LDYRKHSLSRDSALVTLANTELKMKILSKSEILDSLWTQDVSASPKYTKAEVDSLFAGVVSDGSVPAHTHTEANISDLDKYSKAEADQKIEDGKTTMLVAHLAKSNPHSITKADVGLGDVPNSNVLDFLNALLSDESNPHKVALSDFDTYSRAQTDSQIQTLIEIYRTVHTGTFPEDWAILALSLLLTCRNLSHIGIKLWRTT